jgi:hypothetical protein
LRNTPAMEREVCDSRAFHAVIVSEISIDRELRLLDASANTIFTPHVK